MVCVSQLRLRSRLLLFIWLAAAVSAGRTQGFDSIVRARIHNYASPALTMVMRGFSVFGSLVFLIVASVILFVIFKRIGRPHAATCPAENRLLRCTCE